MAYRNFNRDDYMSRPYGGGGGNNRPGNARGGGGNNLRPPQYNSTGGAGDYSDRRGNFRGGPAAGNRGGMGGGGHMRGGGNMTSPYNTNNNASNNNAARQQQNDDFRGGRDNNKRPYNAGYQQQDNSYGGVGGGGARQHQMNHMVTQGGGSMQSGAAPLNFYHHQNRRSSPAQQQQQSGRNRFLPYSSGGGGGGNMSAAYAHSHTHSQQYSHTHTHAHNQSQHQQHHQQQQQQQQLHHQHHHTSRKYNPRYDVTIKRNLNFAQPTLNSAAIKSRYSHLKAPPEFLRTELSWMQEFPASRPFKFDLNTQITILHKDVKKPSSNSSSLSSTQNEVESAVSSGGSISKAGNSLHPEDENSRFSVRVLPLISESLQSLIESCCIFVEKDSSFIDKKSIFKSLSFLVCKRNSSSSSSSTATSAGEENPSNSSSFPVGGGGVAELEAIGGKWSPSLDGLEPHLATSQTLINTAVRTFKAHTGVDLSSCSRWIRFLEVVYDKSDSISLSQNTGNNSLETVVYFIPDLAQIFSEHFASPNWERIKAEYHEMLEKALTKHHQEEPKQFEEDQQEQKEENEAEKHQEKNQQDDVITVASSGEVEQTSQSQPPESEQQQMSQELDESLENGGGGGANEEDQSAPPQETATHFSQLINISKMRVKELKSELTARNLNAIGLKTALVERLQEAINSERAKEAASAAVTQSQSEREKEDNEEQNEKEQQQQQEEEKPEEKDVQQTEGSNMMETSQQEDISMEAIEQLDTTSAMTKTQEEKEEATKEEQQESVMSEEEIARLTLLHTLPEKPTVLLHNQKSGRPLLMRCMHELLNYRAEDSTKNCATFELLLCAEQFREMMQRDAAITIYRHIRALSLPPPLPVQSHTQSPSQSGGGESSAEEQQNGGGDAKRARLEIDEESVTQRSNNSINSNKPRTTNLDLLFSFNVFDTENAGYLKEHDLEEILGMLELSLSKAQMRSLFSHLSVHRNCVMYRDLLDKVDSLSSAVAASASISNTTEEEKRELDAMRLGNAKFFDKTTLTSESSASYFVINANNKQEVFARLEELRNESVQFGEEFEGETKKLADQRANFREILDCEADFREQIFELQTKVTTKDAQCRALSSTNKKMLDLSKSLKETVDRALSNIDSATNSAA